MTDIVAELTRLAASHEVDGERRTADLLRRSSKEIHWLRTQLAELQDKTSQERV